jgi:hypothetical protein
VLAAALAVYMTNESLAGATAASFSFQFTANGVGVSTINVGSNGAAFGVANNTTLSVLDILFAVNEGARNGILYDLDGSGVVDDLERALRNQANEVFTAINEQGDVE